LDKRRTENVFAFYCFFWDTITNKNEWDDDDDDDDDDDVDGYARF